MSQSLKFAEQSPKYDVACTPLVDSLSACRALIPRRSPTTRGRPETIAAFTNNLQELGFAKELCEFALAAAGNNKYRAPEFLAEYSVRSGSTKRTSKDAPASSNSRDDCQKMSAPP
jgi:hypothetical protein